jgi:periplasmic divalent cation tolerance protein
VTDFVVLLVTVGSPEEGERIAEALVTERLAACVNVIGPIRSIYTWKGELERDDEHLLIVKSRAALFDRIEERIRSLHSYETPEVVALPIEAGSQPYLDWLAAVTQAVGSESS